MSYLYLWANSQRLGNLIFAVFIRDRKYWLSSRRDTSWFTMNFSSTLATRILPNLLTANVTTFTPRAQQAWWPSCSFALQESLCKGTETPQISLFWPAVLENVHIGDDQNTSSFSLEGFLPACLHHVAHLKLIAAITINYACIVVTRKIQY